VLGRIGGTVVPPPSARPRDGCGSWWRSSTSRPPARSRQLARSSAGSMNSVGPPAGPGA